MKKFILIFLLATAVLSGNLGFSVVLGSSDDSSGQIYNLQSTGNTGQVIYEAIGLPAGVYISGSQLVVSPSAASGTW